MLKKTENPKEITLYSGGKDLPLKIKFVGKDNNITDYILSKTRKEKLILQKPIMSA
jgi:hypothetical protein